MPRFLLKRTTFLISIPAHECSINDDHRAVSSATFNFFCLSEFATDRWYLDNATPVPDYISSTNLRIDQSDRSEIMNHFLWDPMHCKIIEIILRNNVIWEKCCDSLGELVRNCKSSI